MDDAALMAAALEQAALGLENGELPIGAVLVLDEEIVGRAFWQSEGGLLSHPELVVLLQADRSDGVTGRRRDLSLYTTLEPCLLCMAAAMFALCGRIVYALESPTDGGAGVRDVWDPAAGSNSPYRFPDVVGGVGRAESVDLVREFVRRSPDTTFASWARTLI